MDLFRQILAAAHEQPVELRHRQMNPGRTTVVALVGALGCFRPLGVAINPAQWHDATVSRVSCGFPGSRAIMFINPMWDSESQRLGKQKCTPRGYRLHLVSDLVGFFALFLLLATLVYLRFRSVLGTFHESLWWLLAVPIAVALGGTLLHRYSWLLAERRGFRYDYETSEARWMENGQPIVFKWPAAQETRGE